MTQSVEHLFEFDWKSWTFFLHWTQRIELFSTFWLKELSLFLKYESKSEFFLRKYSHPKKRLKELNPFVFFSTVTSKNWTLCKWLIELSLFHEPLLNKSWIFLFLTQRIELFFEYDSINRTHFLNVTQKLKFSVEKVKNETFQFFENSKIDFLHMTRRIEPAFFNMTQRIELFFEIDSKFFKWTRRIEPFFFFQYDSTNRTFLKCDSVCKMIQRTEPLFLKKITQRIGLDSKTWTLCFSNLIPRTGLIFDDSQTWSFFLELWHKEFFWKKKKWLKELDQNFWLKEMFFLYGSKKWFFVWLKEMIFLNMTQRIETFFFEYDAENWCLFLFLPQRIETFSSLPQMIELFFSKILLTQRIELFFLIWLKEMKSEKKKKKDSKSWTCFLKYDLQNWTSSFFTNMIQRIELCVKKKLKKSKSSFSTMTQRIELFVNDS